MTISYARKKANALTKFQESMRAKREEEAQNLNEERANQRKNSFGFKRNPKKSIQRIKSNSHVLNEALKETLLDIIQEACPIEDIQNVDRKRLRESVDEVLTLHKGNIVADDGTINVSINQGGANPNTASNIIQRCAKLRIEGGSSLDVQPNTDEFGCTLAYNNIDTMGAVGADESIASNGKNEFTERELAVNGAYRTLTATVSEAIRKRVMANYQSEIRRLNENTIITEGDLEYGLSEAAKMVRRKEKLREGVEINPVKEIFRSIRILSEGAENVSHENLLKETMFHMTVLETYNSCGLLELTDMTKFVQNLRENTNKQAHKPA